MVSRLDGDLAQKKEQVTSLELLSKNLTDQLDSLKKELSEKTLRVSGPNGTNQEESASVPPMSEVLKKVLQLAESFERDFKPDTANRIEG